MNFITLALGALGLAGFTVGVATHKGPSSHFAIPQPVSTSYPATPQPVSTSYPATPQPMSSSQYAVFGTTSLSHWHPEPIRSIPTQSFEPITPLVRRDEIFLTLPFTSTCWEGFTTQLEAFTTSVCTVPQTTAVWDRRPCADSWYKYWICMTTVTATTTRSMDWGGRRSRWVAQVAAQSSQDFGGRRSRYVEQVAARSTQDLGGRGQRAVPRFAEATVTPAPTPVAARAIPTCSFDLSKGEYVCPKAQTALSTCSFDLTKGEYVCPGHKIARAAATPAAGPCPEDVDMCIPANEVAPASPCPAGVEFCIPADEREEIAAPAPCPERVEVCVPRDEVATPTTLESVKS
jgi:hypothetical protein